MIVWVGFWKRELYACEATKGLEARGWFGNCGIFAIQLWEFGFHSYEGRIKSFLWQFMMKSTSRVGSFNSVVDRNFWRLNPRCWVVRGPLFHTKHLTIQHCASELYFPHLIGNGMPCHQQMQRIWIHIMIFVWGSQNWRFVLHELCICIHVC
jgi:hypothetical protein